MATESLALYRATGRPLGHRHGASVSWRLQRSTGATTRGQRRSSPVHHQRPRAWCAWGTALDLANLGWLVLEQGDNLRASELFEEALEMMAELGDLRDPPDALVGLGLAVQRQGDLARASALLRGGALHRPQDRRPARHRAGAASASAMSPGNKVTMAGRCTLVQQALTTYQAMGDPRFVVVCVEAARGPGCGDGRARTRRAAAGSRLRGDSSALGTPVPGVDRIRLHHAATQARETMGTTAFDAASAAGDALDPGRGRGGGARLDKRARLTFCLANSTADSAMLFSQLVWTSLANRANSHIDRRP